MCAVKWKREKNRIKLLLLPIPKNGALIKGGKNDGKMDSKSN